MNLEHRWIGLGLGPKTVGPKISNGTPGLVQMSVKFLPRVKNTIHAAEHLFLVRMIAGKPVQLRPGKDRADTL